MYLTLTSLKYVKCNGIGSLVLALDWNCYCFTCAEISSCLLAENMGWSNILDFQLKLRAKQAASWPIAQTTILEISLRCKGNYCSAQSESKQALESFTKEKLKAQPYRLGLMDPIHRETIL
jgi:hypothetical protein